MRKTILLSAFLLYSIFSFGQATVVWDGGGDGHSWDDGDNWNPNGIPAAGDFVKLKKNVTIDGTATNNPGRIIIVTQGTNPSSVVLDLDLTIDGIPDQHSITFNEGCSLTVSIGRTLSVTAPNNRNGINTTNANQNASFINNGSVIFSGCKNGIYLDGTNCSVENHGSITITSPSSDGIHISYYIGTQFININGATLTINNPSQDGIENYSSFMNHGTLSIDGAGLRSILQQSGSNFLNTGEISITNVAASNDGIRLEGDFINETNGVITIHGEIGDDCISLNGGTFTNDGSITLYANGSLATNNGLAIDENGATGSLFENTSNNSLTIHSGGTLGRGIYVYPDGELQNTGTITIDQGKPYYRFYSKGTVKNQKGGKIDVEDGKIRAYSGTFTNDGLLKSTLNSGLVDEGATTTNNGFYDWSTSEFDTDNGIALNNTAATISTGDDGDNNDCTADIAEVDYKWNDGTNDYQATSSGQVTFSSTATSLLLKTTEYGDDVQITVTDVCTSLPLVLNFIKAKREKNFNIISWETFSEDNVDYFELQKSTDGVDFNRLAVKESKDITGNYYEVKDNDIDNKVSFYRLAAFDLDGLVTYSEIVSVINNNKNDFVKIYPTTVKNTDRLNVIVNSNSKNKNVDLYIYDIKGREILKFSDNQQKSNIDLSDFNPGLYIVKIISSGNIYTKKFLIVK